MYKFTSKICLFLVCSMLAGLFSFSGCDSGKDTDQSETSETTEAEIETDYKINYADSTRDTYVEKYASTTPEADPSSLYTNIVASITSTDETGYYWICIDNYSEDEFFDGVVSFSVAGETYTIDAHMIAPDTYEYIIFSCTDDVSDFTYTVDGDFYKMEGLEFPENYYNEVSLNANATETAVIIDQDEITADQIKDIAVFLYERDSLYNFAYPCAFYVCTYDNFNNSADFTYTYEIDVDTTTQTTTIYDANQNLIE